jgi:hypothetical protein
MEFRYEFSIQEVKISFYSRDKLIIKSKDQLLFQLVIVIFQRLYNLYKLKVKYVKETM